MATGLGLLFANLEKFNGSNTDLIPWLRQFERCCVVANKNDDNVKGQLLLICVSGQAKAILENYEEEQGAQQTYTALKAALETHYNTTAIKEEKMIEFETRTQKIDETEEEFMFELYNLYKRANPDQNAGVQLTAIKRKFLQGISPDIRRNIFVFCNDPYDAGVSRDQLVQYSLKAKVYLSNNSNTFTHNSNGSSSTGAQIKTEPDNNMVAAIENLGNRLQSLECTVMGNSSEHNDETVNAMYNGGGYRGVFGGVYRGGFRGFRGYRGGFRNQGRGGRFSSRGNRRGGYRGSNRGRAGNSSDANPIRCYKCGFLNHRAEHCTSEN